MNVARLGAPTPFVVTPTNSSWVFHVDTLVDTACWDALTSVQGPVVSSGALNGWQRRPQEVRPVVARSLGERDVGSSLCEIWGNHEGLLKRGAGDVHNNLSAFRLAPRSGATT